MPTCGSHWDANPRVLCRGIAATGGSGRVELLSCSLVHIEKQTMIGNARLQSFLSSPGQFIAPASQQVVN